jgi:Lon-like protease
MTPDRAGGPQAHATDQRGARVMRALFLPVALALIVTAALAVPLPVFVETPREPVDLDERIVLDGPEATLDGEYLLLAVSLRRGTVARVLHGLVDADRTVLPDVRIRPPHEDDAAYFTRQRDVFRETAVIAAGLGLQAAGYPVELDVFTGEGVLVVDVVAGTPAAVTLEAGDVIVEADGTPVRAFEDLRAVLPAEAGSPIDLVIRRAEREERLVLETAVLETPEGRRPGIGIIGHTHEPRIDLPVGVEVEGGRIGGPSAGLMIALTVYDKAAPDIDLAAGRRIAGTGGVNRDGTVRRVGGVRQKVAAARAAGADVLLVPDRHVDAALAALPRDSDLEIIGVATFADALEALRDGVPAATRG